MTRVNVVPVHELCDKHCLAEHREITRIPNTIVSGKAKLDGDYPETYRLGKGHVKVFYNKLKWLHKRYNDLHKECVRRGFNVTYKWPVGIPVDLYNDWTPTPEAYEENRKRIFDRMPQNAKFTKVKL